MKFAIFTNIPHGCENDNYFSYSPYINEMNIWNKYVTEVIIIAPLTLKLKSNLDSFYSHSNQKFQKIDAINFLNIASVLKSLVSIPKIIFTIYKNIKNADHVHIRCPGNIGLLACVVQIFFPNKIKTAKYAGNWDPVAKNPLSYKLQKWILSNTFLTRNMQVLVYGEWQNQSKNIKPFFTATYHESEKTAIKIRNFQDEIKFIFVGMLTSGKNPVYAIQVIEQLRLRHANVNLDIYGEGLEREFLEKYIAKNNLQDYVSLKGNQNLETLKNAYSKSHFLILPSESEGWPKAVAEAMFWGCLPISTNVSCVANMLDYGNSGLLLSKVLEVDVNKISQLIENETMYQQKVYNAVDWSRKYTLNLFEQEIKLLLRQ